MRWTFRSFTTWKKPATAEGPDARKADFTFGTPVDYVLDSPDVTESVIAVRGTFQVVFLRFCAEIRFVDHAFSKKTFFSILIYEWEISEFYDKNATN